LLFKLYYIPSPSVGGVGGIDDVGGVGGVGDVGGSDGGVCIGNLGSLGSIGPLDPSPIFFDLYQKNKIKAATITIIQKSVMIIKII
jgi:hypothetical protein